MSGPIDRHTSIDELPQMLSVPEAAAWLDVAPGTLYEALRAEQLPHVRIGRLVRIPRDALAAMVAGARPGRSRSVAFG